MDQKVILVTINAGKSLFSVIVINGRMRFIFVSVMINLLRHDRYDEKILKTAEHPSDTRED